jgi:hypothetical protein
VAKKPRKKKQDEEASWLSRVIENDRPTTTAALTVVNAKAPMWADHVLARTIVLVAGSIDLNSPLSSIDAFTPGGRPCLIALATGEEACNYLRHCILGAETEGPETHYDDQEDS